MRLSSRCATFGAIFAFFLATLDGHEEPSSCSVRSLPADIQSHLKLDFGSWKVQESGNLSKYARKTWESRKLPGCPGIALGLFQSAKYPGYALLLVPVNHPDAGYRILVFSRSMRGPSYETTFVEKSDEAGASNYFLSKVPIAEFFSDESNKKFQMQTTEAILKVDAGDHEYEADICYWSNGSYRQEPLDY
jgi:hypothetical protein